MNEIEEEIERLYQKNINRYGSISQKLEIDAMRRYWQFLSEARKVLKEKLSIGLLSENSNVRELTNLLFKEQQSQDFNLSSTNPFSSQNGIYPLTIARDRYGGAYSGGEFIALNCHPYEAPEDIFGDDMVISDFFMKDPEELGKLRYGVGESPELAVQDLLAKLLSK